MSKPESILLPLFKELQKQGIPLGISEYLLAIKTIREGIGIEDIDRLERFLKLLWAKSQDDREIFSLKFTELVKPRLEKPIKIATQTNEEQEDKNIEKSINSPSKIETNRTTTPSDKETKTIASSNQQQVNFSTRSSNQLPTINKSPKFRSGRNYNLIPRLFISQREMTVSWRHLRNLKREGVPEDLDIKATIDDICKVGFFRRPVLQPRSRNQIKLILFIDSEGSMSPFNLLVQALQQSIEKGGLLGKVETYYFHDCPEVYLYKKPNFTEPMLIEEVLSEQARNNSVLMVSDGGAARRTYDEQRLKETNQFIKKLSAYTYLYAWLNPVPQSRWRTTTAEDIASFVPMYHLDREGLNDTVKILLGHPFPPGVRLDG